MASAILEKISDKIYEELIKEYIINQLGLNTYIGWPNNYNSEQPRGHIISGKKVEKFEPGHEYKIPYLLTPAGDLSIPPVDFAKYIQLHLKGLMGQDNFIKSSSYQHIHFGRKGFSVGVVNGKLSDISFSGIDGSGGTFFCRAILVPDSDFAFTIMMNAGSGTAEMKAVDWLTMQIVKKHYNWWWKFWL
jgi:D-alanyl-D-alanine carboxypeptidase